MIFSSYIVCRSVCRRRIELGDPSKDVYHYGFNHFICPEGGFTIIDDDAELMSIYPGLMELGEEYTLTLSKDKPGVPVFAFDGNKLGYGGNEFRFWIGHLTIRSKHTLQDGYYYMNLI